MGGALQGGPLQIQGPVYQERSPTKSAHTAGVFSPNSEGPGCSTRFWAASLPRAAYPLVDTPDPPPQCLRSLPVQTSGAFTNVWQGVPATWHDRWEVNRNQDGNRS
jgi:hypothetical protein